MKCKKLKAGQKLLKSFGVEGAGGPGRTSDTGDVTGGAEGDLDAYLNQVGTTSLFEIVNKRMDKYSSEVTATE